jgi:predicted Zn finger-like uncharacterized protein
MYARCPECQTIFRITPAQLRAHAGMVRCGQCHEVFRADVHGTLSAASGLGSAATEALKPPGPRPAAVKPAKSGAAPGKKTKRRAAGTAGRKARKSSASTAAPDAAPVDDISQISAPLLQPRARPRIPQLLWGLASLVAVLVLIGQIGFLYRHDLARTPELLPLMTSACELLDCEIHPPRRPVLIELLDQTRIAPHPKYENVLRLRAAMVNRTEAAQTYPLMEVSLTNSNGELLARRTFQPREYLEQPTSAAAPMPAGVVMNALIDVTNPDNRAVGYEIRLLWP